MIGQESEGSFSQSVPSLGTFSALCCSIYGDEHSGRILPITLSRVGDGVLGPQGVTAKTTQRWVGQGFSEGLMALGGRRSTFLAEEKHMQSGGGGSGGGSGVRHSGSNNESRPGAGGTLGEPGRCCTKVTFMVSYIPSLPP